VDTELLDPVTDLIPVDPEPLLSLCLIAVRVRARALLLGR
jgi:hypothetical protein